MFIKILCYLKRVIVQILFYFLLLNVTNNIINDCVFYFIIICLVFDRVSKKIFIKSLL